MGSLSGKPILHSRLKLRHIKVISLFFARLPRSLHALAKSQLYAHYPDAEIETVPEYLPKVHPRSRNRTSTDKYRYLPIQRYSQFEDKTAKVITDPLSVFFIHFRDSWRGNDDYTNSLSATSVSSVSATRYKMSSYYECRSIRKSEHGSCLYSKYDGLECLGKNASYSFAIWFFSGEMAEMRRRKNLIPIWK